MDVTFSPTLRVYAELWEIAGRRRGADAQFAQALAHIRSGTPDAMYVMLTFLEVNGIHMECTNEEVVEVGLSVASAQRTTTRFSNGCATTGADGFEGSR